jgi:hypothetical protein
MPPTLNRHEIFTLDSKTWRNVKLIGILDIALLFTLSLLSLLIRLLPACAVDAELASRFRESAPGSSAILNHIR